MKNLICNAVDAAKPEILELSHKIHDNPELGFEEKKAVQWQTEVLERHGFTVECPFKGMPTAYKAVFKGKQPGPRIAFLAEYDALKNVGHGCGHNIIASSAVGAGIGLSKVIKDMAGEVIVMGTPAEEGGGGKIILVEQGAFDRIDYAIMIHPAMKNVIGRGGLASNTLTVEFFGKPAHSSMPDRGINALTSLISLFNDIDILRQTWKEGSKINGMIANGGVAPNIIPEYTCAKFTVRARTVKHLTNMIEDIKRVADAAGQITGATVKVTQGRSYAERYPNRVMGEVFKANMEGLGEKMYYTLPDEPIGSSDIGNVSLVVPTIHEYMAIAPENLELHSVEFRDAAVSERGDTIVVKSAKGMAMTAYDIFIDADLRDKINKEFSEKILQH